MGLLTCVFGGWGLTMPRSKFDFALLLPRSLWFALRCDHAVPRFGFVWFCFLVLLLKPAAGVTPLSAAYYCFRIHSWILGCFANIGAWQQESLRRIIPLMHRIV